RAVVGGETLYLVSRSNGKIVRYDVSDLRVPVETGTLENLGEINDLASVFGLGYAAVADQGPHYLDLTREPFAEGGVIGQVTPPPSGSELKRVAYVLGKIIGLYADGTLQIVSAARFGIHEVY